MWFTFEGRLSSDHIPFKLEGNVNLYEIKHLIVTIRIIRMYGISISIVDFA